MIRSSLHPGASRCPVAHRAIRWPLLRMLVASVARVRLRSLWAVECCASRVRIPVSGMTLVCVRCAAMARCRIACGSSSVQWARCMVAVRISITILRSALLGTTQASSRLGVVAAGWSRIPTTSVTQPISLCTTIVAFRHTRLRAAMIKSNICADIVNMCWIRNEGFSHVHRLLTSTTLK